jgi:hypothetical protein
MDTNKVLCSLITLSLLASGCAGLTLHKVTEEYTTIKGTLAAPPILQGSRLKVYFRPLAEGKPVLIAVAKNREKKDALSQINAAMLDTTKPIFLFGTPHKGRWENVIEGVDFTIAVVGVHDKFAEKYVVLHANHGKTKLAAIRSSEWVKFIQVVSKGAKAVAP